MNISSEVATGWPVKHSDAKLFQGGVALNDQGPFTSMD